jgi:hypothetical protein
MYTDLLANINRGNDSAMDNFTVKWIYFELL